MTNFSIYACCYTVHWSIIPPNQNTYLKIISSSVEWVRASFFRPLQDRNLASAWTAGVSNFLSKFVKYCEKKDNLGVKDRVVYAGNEFPHMIRANWTSHYLIYGRTVQNLVFPFYFLLLFRNLN